MSASLTRDGSRPQSSRRRSSAAGAFVCTPRSKRTKDTPSEHWTDPAPPVSLTTSTMPCVDVDDVALSLGCDVRYAEGHVTELPGFDETTYAPERASLPPPSKSVMG